MGDTMQTITKNGRVMCVTAVPYPPEIVRSMKRAGYRVREGRGRKQAKAMLEGGSSK